MSLFLQFREIATAEVFEMGRKSVREDKSIYQISRETAGLTRAAAADRVPWLSESRIEKIEAGADVKADEVLAMAETYNDPLLCNRHCTRECAIGKQNVEPVERKNLSQITLEILSALTTLDRDKERLIEITVDGVISEDEKTDFDKIKRTLKTMASTIDSLELWLASLENGGPQT